MSKRPAFQFYPGDWRNDAGLRLCSLSARGLWLEMMCLMHDAQPYGHLTVLGRPMSAESLARLVGEGAGQVKRWLAELRENEVFSVTEEGVIFSRRMVRDEDLREMRAAGGALGAEHGIKGAEFGKLGGNPKKKAQYNEPGVLYAVQRATGGPIKVGITKHPKQRLADYRRKLGEVLVLGQFDVRDMGSCEAAVHTRFADRLDGEWIDADWAEVGSVVAEMLTIWGGTQPPLSSVSQPRPSSPSPSPEGSEADASGGEAPPDPEKVMFDSGVRLLAGDGYPTAKAKTFLGKWKRDYGAAAVIVALGKAQREGAIDPISFIEGCLRSGAGNGNGYRSAGRSSPWTPRADLAGQEPLALDT